MDTQGAVAHLEAAEKEIAAAIRAVGIGTIYDHSLSFVVMLLIRVRLLLNTGAAV